MGALGRGRNGWGAPFSCGARLTPLEQSDLPPPDDPDLGLDDPAGEPEADESQAADAVAEGLEPAAGEARAPGDVPFCRPIRPGARGLDVVAVKRTLSRAGFLQWGAFTQAWGPGATEACRRFQASVGLPETGHYDRRTHDVLLRAPRTGHPGETAWDAYGRTLMVQFCSAADAATRVRRAIVDAARFWSTHKAGIDYSQARPFELAKPPQVPRRIDCSGFVTICHLAGGGKNPNVERGQPLPWNGYGYTGTLLSGGRKCRVEQLLPGDLVFYGFTTTPTPAFPVGSPTHVAVWLGDGNVMSHGRKEGPELLGYAYREVNCFVTYDVI
jgi:peptidoglycan hydrolase-like protein with peptidoglycan-binding domain